MSPEELRACRERAEAATPGDLSVAREDEDHGAITYAVVRGGLTLAFVPEDTRGKWEHSSAKADATFWASARADVLRLLATLDAAQREAASHRHAALLAAGVHGGPGAWRWASDPTGTTLDDVAAWERMLREMEHGPSLQWEDVPGALQSRARLCGNGASAPRVYLRIRYSDVWHIEYMFDGKAHTTEESVLDCPPVLTDDVKRMAEKWARYEGWIR